MSPAMWLYSLQCHLHDNPSATYHTTNDAITGKCNLVSITFSTAWWSYVVCHGESLSAIKFFFCYSEPSETLVIMHAHEQNEKLTFTCDSLQFHIINLDNEFVTFQINCVGFKWIHMKLIFTSFVTQLQLIFVRNYLLDDDAIYHKW